MITNIVDRRKRQYRFHKINAIIEAAWHDNSCQDSDRIEQACGGPDYEEKEHVSLASAIVWANSFTSPVTLYLYDENEGLYPKRRAPR